MNQHKLFSLISITTASVCLSSCIKTQEIQEPKIVGACAQNICHIELVQADIFKTTNLLGKTTEKVLSTTPLRSASDSLTWTISDSGTWATSEEMSSSNLPACESSPCAPTDNPTGYVFPTDSATHTHKVSVSATIITNGTTKEINLSTEITENPEYATQMTFEDGDYTGVTPSGTDSSTGISWVNDSVTRTLTLTCPSGFAIPNNVPTTVEYPTDVTRLSNPNETQVAVALIATPGGPLTPYTENIPVGVFVYGNNVSGFGMVCIPASGVKGYSS